MNWLAPTSTGVLPPDLLRVLREDGFDCEAIWGSVTGDDATRVRDHLAEGRLAIALTKRRGILHWVLLGGLTDDAAGVLVCDSRYDAIFPQPLDWFLAERVWGIVLVGAR